MKLTEKQQKFFDAVNKDKDFGLYVLNGYAGTGKTVTLSHIVNYSKYNNILIVAPTVKARMTLEGKIRQGFQEKSIKSSTLSKLIEIPSEEITVMKQTYKLDEKGMTDLGLLFDKIKLDGSGIINKRVRYVKDENGDIVEQDYYMIDEFKLAQAFRDRFKKGADSMFGKVVPSFDYIDKSVIAEKLKNYDLIIIDEMSMVGQTSINVLTQAIDTLVDYHNNNGKPYGKYTPVLVLAGDGGQLPPVNEELNAYFAKPGEQENVTFAVTLDKILRSGDNIANVGKLIRKKASPNIIASMSKGSIITKGDVHTFIDEHGDVLKGIDIALAYQNADVKALNLAIRKCRGFSGPYVNEGETVVVLENTVAKDDNSVEFANGEDLIVLKKMSKDEALAVFDNDIYRKIDEDTSLIVEAQVAIEQDLVDYVTFKNAVGEFKDGFIFKDFASAQSYKAKVVKETFKNLSMLTNGINPLVVFDFGYARTIHKSQGSEWPKTLLWLTSFDLWIMKKNDSQRWTGLPYTGYTRAKDECIYVYSDYFRNKS